MNEWKKVNASDFLRDVSKAELEPYKMDGHSYAKMSRIPWVVCRKCGLVSLRNPLTSWCDRVGCLYRRHPEYSRRVKT